MTTTSIRLPDHLGQTLDRLAAERGTTRSELIREAIERFCAEEEKDRPTDRIALLDQLVTYQGSGCGDLGSESERHLRAIFHARRRNRPR